TAKEGRRLVNPELGQRRGEEEERDHEILRRLRLLTAEDQGRKTGHERGEDNELHPPGVLETVEQLVLGSAAAGLPRSETAFDELAAFEEIEHGVTCGNPARDSRVSDVVDTH